MIPAGDGQEVHEIRNKSGMVVRRKSMKYTVNSSGWSIGRCVKYGVHTCGWHREITKTRKKILLVFAEGFT